MTVLLLNGTITILPLLMREMSPQGPMPLRLGLRQPGLWIVESPKGHLYVNGVRKSRTDLARTLDRQSAPQLIHYLPSDALPLATVGRSLRWLRSLAPGAVVLQLSPISPPAPSPGGPL